MRATGSPPLPRRVTRTVAGLVGASSLTLLPCGCCQSFEQQRQSLERAEVDLAAKEQLLEKCVL